MTAAMMYLREIREKKEITQAEVSAVIGIAERTYSRWETGQTKSPDVQDLFRVAHYLGASFEHVGRLIMRDDNTDEDAKLLARSYLTAQDHQTIQGLTTESITRTEQDLRSLPTRELIKELMRREEEDSGQHPGQPSFAT